MTALVVGNPLAFVVHQDHGVAKLSHHDAVASGLEVFHVDGGRVTANGVQRRLVDEVRQVRATHAGRATRDHLQVH